MEGRLVIGLPVIHDVPFRFLVKIPLAGWGAKVVRISLVHRLSCSLLYTHFHSANRIFRHDLRPFIVKDLNIPSLWLAHQQQSGLSRIPRGRRMQRSPSRPHLLKLTLPLWRCIITFSRRIRSATSVMTHVTATRCGRILRREMEHHLSAHGPCPLSAHRSHASHSLRHHLRHFAIHVHHVLCSRSHQRVGFEGAERRICIPRELTVH